MWLNPLACKACLSLPPGVTDGGVSMSTGGCFPGGTVSEADRETGETLCRAAAGIPPAVQVSLAFIPHKPSIPLTCPHTSSHPLTEGTLMPASPSRQCCSWPVQLWRLSLETGAGTGRKWPASRRCSHHKSGQHYI